MEHKPIFRLLHAISDTCQCPENLVEWLPKSLGEPMRAWCLVLRFEESNPQSSEKPWIEIGLLRYLNALGFQPWLNFFHSCQFVLLLFRSYLFVVAGFVDIFFSV